MKLQILNNIDRDRLSFNDQELLDEAIEIQEDYTRWDLVRSLSYRACDPKLQEELEHMSSCMYHQEEYSSGLL